MITIWGLHTAITTTNIHKYVSVSIIITTVKYMDKKKKKLMVKNNS